MGDIEQLAHARDEANALAAKRTPIERECAALVDVGAAREDAAAELAAAANEDATAELAAKRSLKAQISKLDRALSHLVIEGFPHIAPLCRTCAASGDGPRLLTLEQLETHRDALVTRLREVELATAARVEHERRARQMLEGMKLEPGRYRFYKLRAADVGEAGCGVWHVRPRLGPIGMLAGWWQLKLSSGCPLARGWAAPGAAGPLEPTRPARCAGSPSQGESGHCSSARYSLPASHELRTLVALTAISMLTSWRR